MPLFGKKEEVVPLDPKTGKPMTPEQVAELAKPKGRSFRTVALSLGLIMCMVAMLLPSTCDLTILPGMMQLAPHQKMTAAYVLGLLTMGIVAYQ